MSGRQRYIACIMGLLAIAGLEAGSLAPTALAQPAAVNPAAVDPPGNDSATSDPVVKTQSRRQFNLLDFLFGQPRSRRPRAKPPKADIKAQDVPAVTPELPKEPGAQRVHVFGDAFAAGLADGLAAAFAGTPSVEILEWAKPNSGLVRNDYYDWGSALADILANENVSFAVVMIGSNDRQPIRAPDGSWLQMRSAKWEEIYLARVDALLRQFTEKGIPVYWVGLPIMRPQGYAQDMAYLNEVFLARVQRAGGKFIDTWGRFADEEGRYSATGPDVSGKTRRLRAGNGILMTATGNAKLAFFVEQVMRPDLETGGGVARITNFGSGTATGEQRGSVELEMSLTAPGTPPVNVTLAGAPPPLEAVEPEESDAGASADEPEDELTNATTAGLVDEAAILAAAERIAKKAAEHAAREAARKAAAEAKHRRVDYRLLVVGESPPPKTGRADDFAWPRGAEQTESTFE